MTALDGGPTLAHPRQHLACAARIRYFATTLGPTAGDKAAYAWHVRRLAEQLQADPAELRRDLTAAAAEADSPRQAVELAGTLILG